MKKLTRMLSLLLLLGLVLSLCGCSYLDQLRTARATFTENGAIRLSDGTEYLLLPESLFFSPDMSYDSPIYIVEDEEVPLLLISMMGDYGYKSQDGRFISIYSTVDGIDRYYCRSDQYDSIRQRILGDFDPEVMAYSYYSPATRSNQLYILTLQQVETIEYVLNSQRSYKLPAAMSLNYEYTIDLYYYSQDFLFTKDAPDIYYNEGMYYILYAGALIYEVPPELNGTFAAIMSAKVEQVGNY